MSAKLLHRAAGVNGVLELYGDRLKIIRPGGCMAPFPKSEKMILYSKLSSVQWREPGMTSGYIQIVFSGSQESKGGVLDAMKDENTVAFTKKDVEQFRTARELIEGKMTAS